MHIAFAASECVPFSKTGGLADVIGALPPALANLGHKVTVFLPRYRQTSSTIRAMVIPSITVPFDDRYRFCSVLDGGMRAGVQFYFIDYPPFFDRDGLYGTALGDYHDNAERFALFSPRGAGSREGPGRARRSALPRLADRADSHSAEDAVRRRSGVRHHARASSPFTISATRACFQPEILPLLMLPWDLFTMSKLEFYGKVNFLKGAISMADFITTVSRKYSQEIQTAEYGFGLEGVLRARGGTITGILNAVDYGAWNPETRPIHRGAVFGRRPDGKAKCKADLLQEFGLAEGHAVAGGRHRVALRRSKKAST